MAVGYAGMMSPYVAARMSQIAPNLTARFDQMRVLGAANVSTIWTPPRARLFDKANIPVTDHFLYRLHGRSARGITERSALNTYNRGRLYYNPESDNFIRHDSKTGISLVVSKPSSGTVITVFEGNPSPAWIPVPWRP